MDTRCIVPSATALAYLHSPVQPLHPREFPLPIPHYSAATYDERGLTMMADLDDAAKSMLVGMLRKARTGKMRSLETRKKLAELVHLHDSPMVRPLRASERELALRLPVGATTFQSLSALTGFAAPSSATLGRCRSSPRGSRITASNLAT